MAAEVPDTVKYSFSLHFVSIFPQLLTSLSPSVMLLYLLTSLSTSAQPQTHYQVGSPGCSLRAFQSAARVAASGSRILRSWAVAVDPPHARTTSFRSGANVSHSKNDGV